MQCDASKAETVDLSVSRLDVLQDSGHARHPARNTYHTTGMSVFHLSRRGMSLVSQLTTLGLRCNNLTALDNFQVSYKLLHHERAQTQRTQGRGSKTRLTGY